MKVSRPLSISVPLGGVRFAESVHEEDFLMARRADPYPKLVYLLKGVVQWEMGDGVLRPAVGAGTVWAVPARVPHRFHDLEPATLLLLGISPARVEPGGASTWRDVWRGLVGVAGEGRRLTLDRGARQRVEGAWRRALLEQSHPRIGADVVLRALAADVLVLLARLPAMEAERSSRRRVEAVARELEETFFEPWTVERAAQRAGLSRRRLTALFRDVTGRSLGERVTELRLAHAARLLASGDHSILGAMFSSGFGDASHFYRLFRGRFGVAPGRWRAVSAGNSGAFPPRSALER
jgi:AraC-like DNA-binding protein